MPAAARRYRPLGEIGRGGMGSVELVWDEERQEKVARKRLLGAPGDSLIRFKREFRAIAAIRHENLVRLHELDEDGLGPYFTMEYVQGERLLSFCSPPRASQQDVSDSRVTALPRATVSSADVPVSGVKSPLRAPPPGWRCDEARLARAVPQILHALQHLHAHGVVHCDLKPGNGMVTVDGVVKLLDFGVVAEMRGRRGPGNALIAGTPAYMSRERLLGAPPSPSVDLYALGITLFELLTGTLPHETLASLLTERQECDVAVRLRALAPDAPPPYVALCEALLQRDPSLRPTTRDALKRLGVTARPVAPLRTGEPLVGRETLQAALRVRAGDAARGAFARACLRGASGAGKTALAESLAAELESEGWLSLRGRATTNEHVAFNALDGAIDDLAAFLSEPAREGLVASLEEPLGAASMLFPALGAPVSVPRPAPRVRSASFDAIAAILRVVAAACPVLLLIDDAQWADADSIALLDAVVTAAPARVLLVITARDDVEGGRAAAWIARHDPAPLLVGPLDDESVRALIARAALAGGAKASAEAIVRVASAAAGRPFLAGALGRGLAREGGAASDPLWGVAAAIEQAPADARALLCFVLAAGRWTPIATLARAMGRAAGEVVDLAWPLEVAGLVRRDASGGTLGALDVYHDQVRERATALLDPRELALAHDRFVALLAERRDARPSVVVHHLVGAGRGAEAAVLAREAARVAEDQRAFGLASAMYEVALRAPSSDRIPLLRRRGLALERLGDYAAAAACWREVAEAAGDPDERSDAMLYEARALLGGDEIALGYARLNEALIARGEPAPGSGRLADLRSALLFVLGAYTSSEPSTLPAAPPEVEARARRDALLGQFVGYYDPLAGLDVMRRARAAAARAGAHEATAFCDYTFAFFALFGARKAGRVPLYERFRARADRVAAVQSDPQGNAPWPAFLDGAWAMREGAWDRAAERMDAACEMLREQGEVGTQSLMFILFTRAEVELWRQDAFGYERAYQRVRAAVEESHTGTMRCQLEMGAWMLRCWSGDIDGAATILTALDRSWPEGVRTIQRHIIALGVMVTRFMQGDYVGARVLASRLAAGEHGYDPMTTLYASSFANAAAMAEVGALRRGDPEASARRVRRYARIASEGPPFGRSAAVRALGYLEEHLGRPEAAMARFEAAEREALQLGQRVDAAAARFARGTRQGGDSGSSLVDSARALLIEVGVSPRLLTLHELP